VANNLFIPFAAGGGVKNIDDFSKMFHMGADKVVINTYAVQEDPSIIDKAAKIFGSQAIVVNIEAKRWKSNWECYTDCGRIQSQKDVLDWAKEAEQRGAGEILLQSVDMDGRCRGFDTELASEVVGITGIPVVVSSGAGSLKDIKELIEIVSPSGVAIASLLHYDRANIQGIKKYLNNKNDSVT
jgi:cyclase